MRSLELELGTPLLASLRRPLTTPAGDAFLAGAHRALTLADRAAAAARAAGLGELGELPLAATPAVRYTLPALLAEFHRRYPRVAVQRREELGGLVAEDLRRGAADVGVGLAGSLPAGCAVAPLIDEPVVALAGVRTAPAARRKVGLAELAGEEIVFLPPATAVAYNAFVERACREAGFEPRRLVSPASEEQFAVVASGRAVCLVAEGMVARETIPGVRKVPLEPPVYAPVDLARREGAGPAAERFAEVALELRDANGWLRRRTAREEAA